MYIMALIFPRREKRPFFARSRPLSHKLPFQPLIAKPGLSAPAPSDGSGDGAERDIQVFGLIREFRKIV